jgi:hypothetical protein
LKKPTPSLQVDAPARHFLFHHISTGQPCSWHEQSFDGISKLSLRRSFPVGYLDQSSEVEEDLSPPIGVAQNQYQTLPKAVRKTKNERILNETYKKKLTTNYIFAPLLQ